MKIAGLDIGTTGCKLTVFDEKGAYLDKAYQDYPVKRAGGEHEVDVEAIREGVFAVMKAMAKKYPDIAGIGVTSFGETFVMTDGKGKPLHPAMLYTDPRGMEECRWLEKNLGGKTIASITGVKPHEMYSISKIMWMKKNRPDIYQKARHIFLIGDYVVFCLTGKAQIDYSLASRTMAFDIIDLNWSRTIFEAADIDVSLMSETVPAGTVAGTLLPEAAELCGLSADTKIISISHDQVAAAVGAGVFDSQKAVDGAGTVECITPVYDEIPPLDAMYSGNYAVVPYVIPGKYVCYAFSYTGGALIQWCVDTLAKKEKELAGELGISVNEYLEEEPKNPTELLVLPHFAGAATPYMDSGSKGAIVGLTAGTGIRDIYRGCMEGVVYEMLVNMEYLEKTGSHFQMLHATGGGANSRVWMQMKADMLNVPITALKTVDAGTVGSAVLTGIAVGCFKDLEDGAAHMVEKKEVYLPRADMHEKYQKVYRRYRKLYQAVRELV
ncbi:MAG: FGGY-family carbohydrate kinase [Eubacteriales bacterium]|nr:FGGY-family carbohydrate kinase [Eubacteriales bacterium]